MSGLYTQLAEYYDAEYSFKNYRKEAAQLIALVRRYGRSKGREWLDVACGTGGHLQYISRAFHCTGVDTSPQMLRIARRKVPKTRFVRGDMRSFHLGRQYDVVSCLFSGIGHVRTLSGLRRTLESFAAHLKPGGVLLIEPWFTRKTWHPGMVHLLTSTTPELKIARMTYSTVRGGESVLQLNFLIGHAGRGVKFASVTEVSGLFETRTTLNLLRKAGLRARFLRRGRLPGRGLLVAVRPLAAARRRRTNRV